MLKNIRKLFLISIELILLLLITGVVKADVISEIKKKKVLVIGVKDNLYPFGFRNKVEKKIEGYDIDFAYYIADKLGVKPVFKPVLSSDRIPLLKSGDVDILICTMTITPERKQEIDFSYPYFVSKQKFIVKKGTVEELKDLDGKRIVTASGSTSEVNAKNALPNAKIIGFDDYSQAAHALYLEKVFAVTTDESVLVGVLSKMKGKEQYEMTSFDISKEPYGIGVKKGADDLLSMINSTLLEMESSGKAASIFAAWFGPQTATPLVRDFKIVP